MRCCLNPAKVLARNIVLPNSLCFLRSGQMVTSFTKRCFNYPRLRVDSSVIKFQFHCFTRIAIVSVGKQRFGCDSMTYSVKEDLTQMLLVQVD